METSLAQSIGEWAGAGAFASAMMFLLIKVLRDSREERDAMRAEVQADRQRNLEAIAKLTEVLTEIRTVIRYERRDNHE